MNSHMTNKHTAGRRLIALALALLAGMLLAGGPLRAENLLATARIESYTSAIGGLTGVRAMLDGNLVTAWSNAPAQRRPFVFEFSWEIPIVPGGLRIAVPGGPDTGICARVLRIETLAEGTIDYSEARTINLEPREGWQTFLLPAVPMRKMRITVIKNHGDPVYSTINELEILSPQAAGHRESVPARVARTRGPVWLHNGLDDRPAPPYPREALADVCALTTGYDAEAAITFGSTTMPFADAGGALLRLGAYTTVLIDRWYDGQPHYRVLVLTGEATVDATAAEGDWLITTADGSLRLTGAGRATVRTGVSSGTMFGPVSGQAVIASRGPDALPALDGDTSLLTVRLKQFVSPREGAYLNQQPGGILTWLALVEPVTKVGAVWQEFRRNGFSANQAPDTVPAALAGVLAAQALTTPDTGARRYPPGEPTSLTAIWQQGAELAKLLLTGWPAQILAQNSALASHEALLAAAYAQADISAGGEVAAPLLNRYGDNLTVTGLLAAADESAGLVDGWGWLVICQQDGKQAIIWEMPDGTRRWRYATPGEGEALAR